MKNIYFFAILFCIALSLQSQQIEINRINQMPDLPQPYEMRNWHQVAIGYDSLVFDKALSGEYQPLVNIYPSGVNYPNHSYFGLQSYVGQSGSGLEAINVLAATIGASLCGVDKTNQYQNNWVLACEEFFNKTNNQLVYLNSPLTSSGNDWWYDVMPNVFFYQLNDLYPHTGYFDEQFIMVADRWLSSVNYLGGSTTPWTTPYMNYRAFNLMTGLPLETGVPEPETAGSIAWILYHAYNQTQNKKYLVGAEMCLEFLNNWDSNPSYELQLPYGIYTAARMNAEIGTSYDIEKMLNWAFDVGELRQWGAIIGTWNGYDVSGLIGEARTDYRDYAFMMNGMEQMGALVPMLKYDDRYANALGKWCLNVANASRLFYGNYLPEENQSNSTWAQTYDPQSYIAYEALKEIENNISPMATGDAMSGGWAETNLGLYGSSHVGIFGSIIQTTNVEAILKLNLNATNYYAENDYPSYLLYNPYEISKTVLLINSPDSLIIYDGITNQVINNASGEITITIPAKTSVLASLLPDGGVFSNDGIETSYNGTIIDYNNGSTPTNTAPRIKVLAIENDEILIHSMAHIFCTAEDKENENLQYFWSINGDTVEAETELTHTFTEVGFQSIECIVTDSEHLSDTAFLSILVVEKIEEPPVVELMTAYPPKIQTENQTTLTCQATDPNLNLLTYQWFASSGNISGDDENAIFTAPATAGIYYIRCLVTDIDNLFTMDSTAVIVYDSTSTITGNLIASYKFSNSVWDYSGNGHNGTANNCQYVADFHGNPEEAISLVSSSSFIDIPNEESLNFEEGISISMLVKPTLIQNHEMFIISHGSWEQRWKISILDNGKLRFTINGTEGICDVDSKTILQENEYYHVVGLYNGTTMELYMDSSLENFSIFSGMINPSTYDLVMGRNTPGSGLYNFTGILDDVKLFDYGLSFDEVQTQYQNDMSAIEDYNQPGFQVNIFPNPASDHITLKFRKPLQKSISIEIYSVDSRQILVQQVKKGEVEMHVPLKGTKPGLHIIKLIGEAVNQETKLIIY